MTPGCDSGVPVAPVAGPQRTISLVTETLAKTNSALLPSGLEIALLSNWTAQCSRSNAAHAVVKNIAWLLDLPIPAVEIDAELPYVDGYPALGAVVRFLRSRGLAMQGARLSPSAIDCIGFPAVARLKDAHFVVLVGCAQDRLFYLDGCKGWQDMPVAQIPDSFDDVVAVPTGTLPPFSRILADEIVSVWPGNSDGLRVVDDVFTEEACGECLAQLADFEHSRVMGADGKAAVDDYRTSRTALLPSDLPLVEHLKRFASAAYGLSAAHCEPPTVNAYAPGEQFGWHYDAYCAATKTPLENDRLGTVVLYLNGDIVGGETHFPRLDTKVSPKAGRAAIWRNLTADGSLDLDSLHAGLPVYSGKKYAVAVHVWDKAYDAAQQLAMTSH